MTVIIMIVNNIVIILVFLIFITVVNTGNDVAMITSLAVNTITTDSYTP